jgi:hypothetical protein
LISWLHAAPVPRSVWFALLVAVQMDPGLYPMERCSAIANACAAGCERNPSFGAKHSLCIADIPGIPETWPRQSTSAFSQDFLLERAMKQFKDAGIGTRMVDRVLGHQGREPGVVGAPVQARRCASAPRHAGPLFSSRVSP